MALEPIDNNAQVQRLTIALKNICRDYPAGGTVLRELLQNADDAGATEMRFILDERAHPADELIHAHLQQYQGPALIAYNNAEFTPDDFRNLSNIGDSIKIQDGLTTGKFGRGFNSVYNWTDSPSIVSRERLLILDPHLRWSQGGPVYDFVENSENVAIQNQMMAFQSVMENQKSRFDGTIIRIPLRTKAQATQSQISNRETSVSEVREVLQKFAKEFQDGGLLFMRNIEKVRIESTSGLCIKIEMANSEDTRLQKSQINYALKVALKSANFTFNLSFKAEIEYSSPEESRRTEFALHHSIRGNSILTDNGLRNWANDQRLIPWVAIAAQILNPQEFQGKMFSVLPLPILTRQPVHIHGLFSISPDRARLYQLGDTSAQDRTPALWNDLLFHRSVPEAWTKLLGYLAITYPHLSGFDWWPRNLNDIRDPLTDAFQNVIKIIENESLPLFPTKIGYVAASCAFLATGDESIALRDALKVAKVPVVYMSPQRSWHMVKHLFNSNILSPHVLCKFLKIDPGRIDASEDITKQTVLEYLMSEPGFFGYGDLKLFPFEDGEYRSIEDHVAFVHRDTFESGIFYLEGHLNIDLNRVSVTIKQTLINGCGTSAIHPSIQRRTVDDLRNYYVQNVFNEVLVCQDMIASDGNIAAFVSKAWTWIEQRELRNLDAINCLWLIPLTNSTFRKIKPEDPSSEVLIAQEGEMGDLLMQFDSWSSPVTTPLLLRGQGGLSPHAQILLTEAAKRDSNLLIRDSGNLVDLTRWLNQNAKIINAALDEERDFIVKHIASTLSQPIHGLDWKGIGDALRPLKIFRKLSWKAEDNKMMMGTIWTCLNSSKLSIGLADGINPIPEIDGVQFIDAPWSSHSKNLLKTLRLADCKGIVDIIETHIIPAWKSEQANKWEYSVKEQCAALLLRQYSCLSAESQRELETLAMVPVARLNGHATSKFSAAEELIDPSDAALRGLFFEEEEVLPVAGFFSQFQVALRGCGLNTAVNETLVKNRIRCYSGSKYSVQDVQKRAHFLLRSSCRWISPIISWKDSELQQLKWLPVTDANGILRLEDSNHCRGLKDRLLINLQLPILDIPISAEWEARLGWHDKLPHPLLLGQLNKGLERKDRAVVDAVCSYIATNGELDVLATQLMNTPFVLTTNGVFVIPSKAFCCFDRFDAGCDRLHPYLGNVDNKFWQDHSDLLTRLGIGKGPHLKDLLGVQAILESKVPLNEADVAVAIEILNLASRFKRASLTDLKVLSKEGKFCPINDISYHNLGPLVKVENSNLTHPDIPLKSIQKVGIELLSDRQIKKLLEISDIADEDEFDQREQVTTGIANTLDAYPVNSTFREYLANADDTKGASVISWLLDERTHPDEKLLTPELKKFQGPAFLVYNDGVFSDDDFKGFKNVGEGSKRQEAGSIGQFGRGSQTMYHWTDVPMILSGKYLLILDPQQEVLPKNMIKGKRKPGVKLELSKLKDVCPDQLAPFEGLWKYTKDLDHYRGTIFRFPLRLGTTESKLRRTKRELDGDEIRKLMDEYFHEARISFLFLRRIRSIDFTIYGKHNSGWSLNRKDTSDEDLKSFSESVVCSFTKNVDLDSKVSGTDNWLVAIEDIQPETERLPYSPRRKMKNIECGIAALVSTKQSSHNTTMPFPKILQPRMFSILPLPIPSDLPIYIHATFSLSGDRQSLIVDEHGEESHGSSWNRYLLGTALPKLYLSFLGDIGTRVPRDVLNFWPQNDPPNRSCSEIICSSFWKELPKSSQRLFRKYKLNVNTGRRQAPELYDIKGALFDLLPKNQSDTLAPLFLSLGLPLVRNFPKYIGDHLKQLEVVNQITGPFLRELCKSENNKRLLQEAVSKNPEVLEVLLKLAIPAGEDQSELDGCHFLPLNNGTLGTLMLVPQKTNDVRTTQLLDISGIMGLLKPNITSTEYYVASTEEIKLFEFASALLVSAETGEKFQKIVDSRKFNIQKLELCHVQRLLKERPLPKTVNAETNEWLAKFWEYWNTRYDSLDPVPNIAINDHALYLATCDGIEKYVNSSALEKLPSVVEPTVVEHQQLCRKIPELHILHHSFMPTSRAKDRSFSTVAAFYRFIKAMRALAVKKRVSLGVFLKNQLWDDEMELLRSLLVANSATQEVQFKTEFDDVKDDLKSIPFWPSCDPSHKELISANDALITDKKYPLVPWMKNSSQFIEPEFAIQHQNCLSNLDIKKVSGEGLMAYILPIPKLLSLADWRYYKLVIGSMSQNYNPSLGPLLTQSKIAADIKRNLCRAEDLFDHDEPIFKSAFRVEGESKFLHNDIKPWRSFWLKLGLRCGEYSIKSSDYVQCLKAISRRLAARDTVLDADLGNDCRIVLSPLITPSSKFQKFGNEEWSSISKEAVFLSRTDFSTEPEYRQDPMATLVIMQQVLCLSEIISQNYTAVCWSQTTFAAHEPTKEVLSKMQSKGEPSLAMVWRHIQHLKEMAQYLKQQHVRSFLADLHSSYAYIQNHPHCGRISPNIRNAVIWLNIDSVDGKSASLVEVQSSWTSIQDLVLSSSCDAGQVKAVRPGLMQYGKLLKALGCRTITYPTVTRPVLHHGRSVVASLRKLREERKLLDVKFLTEGKYIEAHRVVLAAVSEKCAIQFSGRWPVESVIKCGEEEDPDAYLSYHTLSTMINYAYEDDVDWSEMEVSDSDDDDSKATKLEMLLDLLKGADYWLIPTLKSQAENRILDAGKEFINIENVLAVRDRAAEAGAKSLKEMCTHFITSNRFVVERVHGKLDEANDITL